MKKVKFVTSSKTYIQLLYNWIPNCIEFGWWKEIEPAENGWIDNNTPKTELFSGNDCSANSQSKTKWTKICALNHCNVWKCFNFAQEKRETSTFYLFSTLNAIFYLSFEWLSSIAKFLCQTVHNYYCCTKIKGIYYFTLTMSYCQFVPVRKTGSVWNKYKRATESVIPLLDMMADIFAIKLNKTEIWIIQTIKFNVCANIYWQKNARIRIKCKISTTCVVNFALKCRGKSP